ncbi:MAG: DUF3168 domain-containing protein [Pseudomonadota bacterium]
MSYVGAGALQTAVFQTLLADTDLGAIVGSDIYDVLPSGTLPSIYVTIGDEEVKDASYSTGSAARVSLLVSVVSDTGGYANAKAAATAISNALVGVSLTLTEGYLVGLWFQKSSARRTDDPDVRRLDLTFDALVQETV